MTDPIGFISLLVWLLLAAVLIRAHAQGRRPEWGTVFFLMVTVLAYLVSTYGD